MLRGGFKEKNVEIAKASTDSNGRFIVDCREEKLAGTLYLEIRNGVDRRFISCREPYDRSRRGNIQERTLFFTDRGIYRPGQTVHYKGICVRADQVNNIYSVISDRNVHVRTIDRNAQEIFAAYLTTNGFGSFSGSFTIPHTIIPGGISIHAESPPGRNSLQVEEYKRPKFQVKLHPGKTRNRLGDTVTVVGTAKGYAGESMGNDSVSYRVYRRIHVPWWSRQSGLYGDLGRRMQISHGVLETNTDGAFEIRFHAERNPVFDPQSSPEYRYTVEATVTSSDGESRSEEAVVKMADYSLDMDLSLLRDALTEGDSLNLVLTTKTLNGEPVGVTGMIRILRLQAPEENAVGGSDWVPAWEMDDGTNWKSWPVAEVVRETAFTTLADGLDTFQTRLPAGLYRIEAVSTTQDEQDSKGILPVRIFPSRDSTKFPFPLASTFVVGSPGVDVGDSLEVFWGSGYKTGRAYIEATPGW